jgi:hypothetical protein
VTGFPRANAANLCVLASVCLRFDSEPTMASATPFYLFPVLQDLGVKGERVKYKGLVLKPTNKCKGEHQRIGYFLKDDSPGAQRPDVFKTIGSMDLALLHYTKLDRELLFETNESQTGHISLPSSDSQRTGFGVHVVCSSLNQS